MSNLCMEERSETSTELPHAPPLWASPPSGLDGPHLEAAGLEEDRTRFQLVEFKQELFSAEDLC